MGNPSFLAQFAKPLFGLVIVVYAVLWAPLGLDTKDGGFLLGLAWRILHGDVPYRDFFYHLPPLPLYLRILPLLFGDFAIYADRIVSLAQFAIIATAGTAVLLRSLRRDREPALFWSLATCCFIMSVHNFPLFGWYTTDAVFFAALALLALTRHHYLLCGALAAASLLCKQNFAAIMLLFGLMTAVSGARAALYYLLGAAVVVGGVASLLAVQGGLGPMLVLVFGVGSLADIWDAGVSAYARQLLSPDAGLAIVAAAAAAIVARRVARSAAEARIDAYTALVLAILAAFVMHVVHALTWSYSFSIKVFYGASTIFVFAGAWMIDWARRNRRLFQRAPRAFLTQSFLPIAALFAIAWSSSISWGYTTPAYFAAPMLAPIFADRLAPSKAIARLWLIAAFAFAAFGTALVYPYGENSRADLLVSAPSVVSGAALMRTSATNAAKLEELAALIAQNPHRAISVLPTFTSFDLLFGMKPPSPVDWSGDVDFAPDKRPAYTAVILNRMCAALALVAVEKDMAAEFQHRGNLNYSSVLEHVENEWRPAGQTAYFALYDSPESCRPQSTR